MRRFITFALICVLFLNCTACGSKRMEGISDRAYELGMSALETADEFIDGTISASSAKAKIGNASTLANGCTGDNDSLVSSAIFFLEYAIAQKDAGTGTMQAVKEKRDHLAEYLGE